MNILREKSFRLYNLNSLDDKFELLFATNKLFPKLSVEEQEYWKGNIFTLSMCQFTTELQEKSFDIWRNYGQDGDGVGIVLSFNKENQQNWMNRYLSKIYYNSNNLDNFLDKHNNFVDNNYFPILGDHLELLLNLSCFHKSSIYKSEKEVRYIEIENGFDKPSSKDIRLKLTMTDDTKMPLIFAVRDKDAWEKHKAFIEKTKFDLNSEIDLGKDFKPLYFRRLYIKNEDRNNKVNETVTCPHVTRYVNDIFPDVRIEKIILGYRYNEEKLQDIRNVINEISSKILGYEIEVEISKLKKYF